MIDEEYSEESFIQQFRERGGVSFKNMPCPLHKSYPSSITLYGLSATCCGEQSKWFENEIDRLGLRTIADKFTKAHRRQMEELEKRESHNQATVEALANSLIGATITKVQGPNASAFSMWVTELEVVTKEGEHITLAGGDDGYFVKRGIERS